MAKFIPQKPKPIQLTQEKYDQSKKEHLELTKERKEILVRLQTAREMGDLSENGAYTAAKFELRSTDRQLRHLDRLIRWGKVVKSQKNDTASFDSHVTLDNGQKQFKYHLVSGFESDPSKGKLSVYSPLGKAIIGKSINAQVQINTPNGNTTYKILKIE